MINPIDILMLAVVAILVHSHFKLRTRVKALESDAHVHTPIKPEAQKPMVTWGIEWYREHALTIMNCLISSYIGLIPGKGDEIIAIRDQELEWFLQYCSEQHVEPNYQTVERALKSYSRFEQRLETLYNQHKAAARTHA